MLKVEDLQYWPLHGLQPLGLTRSGEGVESTHTHTHTHTERERERERERETSGLGWTGLSDTEATHHGIERWGYYIQLNKEAGFTICSWSNMSHLYHAFFDWLISVGSSLSRGAVFNP
jgi:hypothetical protein